MRAYVDPRSLEGRPLTLRAKAPGVFAMCIGDLEAGGISLRIHGSCDQWCWSVTGPQLPVFLQPGTGEAGTLAEAQREFSRKFDQWRAWTHGSPAVWNV